MNTMADIEHNSIVDPQIHEPKGVASATASQVYLSTGLGTGAWTNQVVPFSASDISTETLLRGSSLAVEQAPVGTNTAMQVEFGPAQLTSADPVMLAADGTVTVNQAGLYRMEVVLSIGRAGGAGESELFVRPVSSATQIGRTHHYTIDNAKVIHTYEFSGQMEATAGTTFSFELLRASGGDNSGSLYAADPGVLGWDTSASASVTITRFI